MDTADLHPQVEALADNIDDLEEALGPLLQNALAASASKLPLLEKAKLYTLVTYAIESILFSYISLNGVKAKEHAVFTELTRVRQYFQKIKQVEEAPLKPNQTLDKAAAARFIKAGLAGNEQYDNERRMRQAKERAIAQVKFDQLSKKRKAAETEGPAAEAVESGTSSSSSEEAEGESEEPSAKKSKRAKAADLWEGEDSGKKGKKDKKKSKKQAKDEQAAEDNEETVEDEAEGGEEASSGRKKKSSHMPLGHKAAFEALLKGPIPKREDSQAKKKGKGKKKSKS